MSKKKTYEKKKRTCAWGRRGGEGFLQKCLGEVTSTLQIQHYCQSFFYVGCAARGQKQQGCKGK